MNKERSAKYFLMLATTVTALLLSMFSFLFRELYTARLNQISEYELMGQDFVTTIVSIIFVFVILFQDYGKIKTKIIWLGCILYLFYIYAYFSYGGISSAFYLFYIAITGLAFFLFIFVLVDIIKNNQLPVVAENYPRKSISVFLFISIFIITAIEIMELVSKTIVQAEPLNPFYVFYVLDLTMVFPMIVIAGVLNLKKAAWGYLFSGVGLIKIVTILPAIIINDVFHRLFAGRFLDLRFDIIAAVITTTAAIFLVLYLNRISDKQII